MRFFVQSGNIFESKKWHRVSVIEVGNEFGIDERELMPGVIIITRFVRATKALTGWPTNDAVWTKLPSVKFIELIKC